jgi:hypothetical protein
MSELKTLYQDNQINLSNDESGYSITHNNPHVLVLPYITSENYPDKIGVVYINKQIEAITIEVSEDDVDIFDTAKRGLLDKTGFIVKDTDKWDFLGPINPSYLVKDNNPSFSVDITGLVADVPEETDNNFKLIPINEALDSNNAILHSLFLKTFQSKILK